MRILIVTQWFDPEPAFKCLEFAQQLASHGHKVEVLTGFPNYPQGKLYPGYRMRLWQKELAGGIPVVRVPLYPSHDRSAVRRALNYVSFAATAAILGPALLAKPDVIYVYHPPGTVGFAALVLRCWFRVPVVYDVQDLWPDTIAATGMLRQVRAIRLVDGLCRFVYRHVDSVVVQSPGFRKALMARGVAADSLHVIYNWAPRQTANELRPYTHDGGTFTIVFAGTMGIAQGLDTVLDAAQECVQTVPRARFVLIGDGVDLERLKRRAVAMRLPNLEFLGRQSLVATQAILAGAGTLLVHWKDDRLFAITIPSKTQAYLASGRPILMAVRGDAADLVARAGAGILAQPGDLEEHRRSSSIACGNARRAARADGPRRPRVLRRRVGDRTRGGEIRNGVSEYVSNRQFCRE